MRLVVAFSWSAALLLAVACAEGTSSLGGGTGGAGTGGGGGTSPSGGSGGSANPDSGGSPGGAGVGGTNPGDDGGGSTGVGGTGGSHPDDAGGSSGAGGAGGTTIDASGPDGGGGAGGDPIDGAIADNGGPVPPIGDAARCTGEVDIADTNIQTAAVTAINKPLPILAEDAARVTTLDVNFTESRPLTSLRGLECFTSLRSFSAKGPDLRSLGSLNLSPLAGLPALTSVAIYTDREVDYGEPFAYLDLSPLGTVPTIANLVLQTNSIASIAPLALLPDLSILALYSDTLTDLSPIAGATKLVAKTSVSGKRITDITPLADALRGSSARNITIGPTSVSDLSPLARATTLTNIYVTRSLVTDMAPLASLPNLTGLSLADCPIGRIVLSPSVTGLDLSGTSVTDWSPLASSKVHRLTVRRNGITNLAPFVQITALDNGGMLDVLENPFDCPTQITNIWALQQRGVEVTQDCQP